MYCDAGPAGFSKCCSLAVHISYSRPSLSQPRPDILWLGMTLLEYCHTMKIHNSWPTSILGEQHMKLGHMIFPVSCQR
jgi:hypothetical protein